MSDCLTTPAVQYAYAGAEVAMASAEAHGSMSFGSTSSPQAQRIVAGFASGKEQRERAMVELSDLAETARGLDEAQIDTALQCIGPLVQEIICADVDAVDAAEYRRACLVLCNLYRANPEKIGQEYFRHSRFEAIWRSPHYTAVFAKEAAELSIDDARTIHCATVEAAFHACGWDATMDPSGKSFLNDFLPANHTLSGLRPSTEKTDTTEKSVGPAFLEKLARLLLDIAQESGTTELEQAGVWLVISAALSGREQVARPLIEAGVLDVVVALLTERRRKSPAGWLSLRTQSGVAVGNMFVTCWSISTFTSSTLNITSLLVEKGFVEVAMQALKDYESAGVSKAADCSTLPIWASLRMIDSFDLNSPEAVPVVKRLDGMGTTLRYVLDNPKSHAREIGYVSSADCARVLAFAFGKSESLSLLDADAVDGALCNQLSTFSGLMAGFTPMVPSFFFRPILHLSISDANKVLLVQSSHLVQLLIDGLLIDPEHSRFNQAEDVKAAIQCDSAECLMQLALYDQTRDVLKEHGALLAALRKLVDVAMTGEAKKSAQGALMAFNPHEVQHHDVHSDTLHVMMSYSWEHQQLAKRIVAELQKRGYLVWFDLERMKGSVVDAMAEAIEGAEVFLFGVSQSYKESANCRLEASYAHQRELDMLPLMFEEEYTATGWLGILLGTRLYYRFFPSAVGTDAEFQTSMEALSREIGNRGKKENRVVEGVPPAPVHASKPAFSLAAAPASAGPGAIATHNSSVPSMRQLSSPAQATASGESASAFMSVLLEREEKWQAQVDKLREEAFDAREAQLRDQQVILLHARLQLLLSNDLLTGDEFCILEDIIADSTEDAVDDRVRLLLALSAKMAQDRSFARQLRRKYC